MAQEGSASTAPVTSKRSAKKKKRVSKHILQANKDKLELQKARSTEDGVPDLDLEGSTPIVTKQASSSKKKDSKKQQTKKKQGANKHTKDVKEAAGYLSNWKHHKDAWKFNKNTQSWLIRHMYEANKVSKSTFALLLEYLEGLKGEGAKGRILKEATRRALRYHKFNEENEGEEGKDDNGNEVQDEDFKTVTFSEGTKEPVKEDEKKRKLSKKEQQAATDEEARWTSLDEHDKRKEYKRARKVLETLRNSNSKASS